MTNVRINPSGTTRTSTLTNIIVIPDAHAKPDVSNDRFLWLGRLVADLQPDVVISLGDWADMPSLSSYDVGKKSFEGRRYQKDIESVQNSLDCFQQGIDEYNLDLRLRKVKQYRPKKKITLGNHENRINRACNNDPKLEGTMEVSALGYEDHGWETIPFLVPLNESGILFQHYFCSGGMDRPVGGVNVGRSLLKRNHGSSFQGHSHLLDLAWEANSKGELMTAGSLGCYFDHNEDYLSIQAQNNFWRGVAHFKGCDNGLIQDIDLISMATIKKNYK